MKTRIVYSRLASREAGKLAALHYGLPESVGCRYFVTGLHDNYLVESDGDRFILRVYRNDWRSREETGFELELLDFLGGRSAPVACPRRTLTGELCFPIDCPEGERVATLFPYARGCAPGRAISVEQSAQLGSAVAGIHGLSEDFRTVFSRAELDLPWLLDASVEKIMPFLDSGGRSYLGDLQTRLHQCLPGIDRAAGVYGICAGDINPGNFHVSADRQLTLFDFDQCGYGYRAFEIGKYFSSLHTFDAREELAEAFLAGYREVRELSQAELDSIPRFKLVAVIWVMAIHIDNAEQIGHKMLQQPFWERRLTVLREMEALLAG